jgi:ribA/ribD-fused uncharacterized protein
MEIEMTEAQIKHMVDRFLAWKLPKTFSPDGGISFERIAGADGPHPFTNEPSGTNLLCATEATEMVRHMLEGLPGASPAPSTEGTGPLKLDTETQVFFYEQDFYVLSNFSSFSLWLAGDRFATSEAAYHYEKFPDATAIQQQILSAPSAHVAFKIAEANKAFRRADWDDVKVDVMRRILREKVRQHEYVRRKLLDTGDRELIENSWRDDFWGWGPNRDGQNMLGKLWMEIRAELRAAPDAARTALAAHVEGK